MKKSILFFWVLIPALGFAQPFSVNWFKVAGGGGTSTGDVFTVTGTFGQHDAGGPMAGGGFSVMSGFWSPANSDSYFNPTGTAPVINSGPQLVLLTTSAAVINVSVSGTDPIFYQWKKGALNLKDATNSSLNLNLAAAGYNGSYLLIAISPYGSVTSSVVAVPLYSAPSISVQPRTRTNVVGTIASFSVTAGGNPSPNYQWRQSAVIITNATGSNYSFLATNAGTFSYDVVVSNFFGTVVSTAANLVATNGTGPSILVQPQSITNVVGGISTLSLTATGNPALVYQWRFNGAFITNATSSSYSFLATNAGDYDVILTNYYGSLTSSVAVLTLTNGTGPSIFAQPQSRTNLIGTVASFSVSAAGNPAPGYQWRLNSSPVAGATGGTYNFTASASGGYDVVVSNYYGSITSAVAVLTVTNWPDLGPGYTVISGVPFSFEDISGTGTRVLTNVDDDYVGAPVGFNFNFYDVGQSSLFIDVNGLITFGSGTGAFGNESMASPSPSINLPCMAVLWNDWLTLASLGGDAVYYQTLGSAGNRRLVVQWKNLFGYPSSPSSVSFETVLYEADSSFVFQYLDVDSGDGRANGAYATVGIRNINGQYTGQNLQWSFYQGVITNSQALRFVVGANYKRIVGEPLNNGAIRLSYVGTAGTNYSLDRTFSLSSPINWVPQETNVAGIGGVLVFTNTPNLNTNNFWRIRSMP